MIDSFLRYFQLEKHLIEYAESLGTDWYPWTVDDIMIGYYF